MKFSRALFALAACVATHSTFVFAESDVSETIAEIEAEADAIKEELAAEAGQAQAEIEAEYVAQVDEINAKADELETAVASGAKIIEVEQDAEEAEIEVDGDEDEETSEEAADEVTEEEAEDGTEDDFDDNDAFQIAVEEYDQLIDCDDEDCPDDDDLQKTLDALTTVYNDWMEANVDEDADPFGDRLSSIAISDSMVKEDGAKKRVLAVASSVGKNCSAACHDASVSSLENINLWIDFMEAADVNETSAKVDVEAEDEDETDEEDDEEDGARRLTSIKYSVPGAFRALPFSKSSSFPFAIRILRTMRPIFKSGNTTADVSGSLTTMKKLNKIKIWPSINATAIKHSVRTTDLGRKFFNLRLMDTRSSKFLKKIKAMLKEKKDDDKDALTDDDKRMMRDVRALLKRHRNRNKKMITDTKKMYKSNEKRDYLGKRRARGRAMKYAMKIALRRNRNYYGW